MGLARGTAFVIPDGVQFISPYSKGQRGTSATAATYVILRLPRRACQCTAFPRLALRPHQSQSSRRVALFLRTHFVFDLAVPELDLDLRVQELRGQAGRSIVDFGSYPALRSLSA